MSIKRFDPEAFIPGNFMGFPGIDEDENRADLIAFLKDESDPGSQAAGAEGIGGHLRDP